MFSSSPASSSSSSGSSSSSSIHPASLVDPSNHSPALLELVDMKLSRPMIEYVIDCVVETVDFALGRPSAPHTTRGRGLARRPEHAKFATFATNVLTRAEVTTPTVLGALVYIDRAKSHLHIALEEWALERVFLGSVITASKYLNDSTLKNVHWAMCTGVFGKRDVGRIEREFLEVLDFELGLTEADLMNQHAGLAEAAVSSHRSSHTHHRATPHVFAKERNHRRSSATLHAIPDLSPSSPGSSDGSTSPQTPPSAVQTIVPPPASKSRKSHHLSLGSIMGAFPQIPITQHLHGSQSYPIHVDA